MFGFGNKQTIGFPGPLYILITDHRSSFIKHILELEGLEPKPEDWQEISNLKKIIFEGFKLAIESGMPKSNTTFFIDELTGSEVIKEAANEEIPFILAVEKSGMEILEFEYGEDFGSHIEKYHPAFIKALVRYNPESREEGRLLQQRKLAELTEYARSKQLRLLIEVRIPATEEQLNKVDGDTRRFDLEIRPQLAVQVVSELRRAGTDPDVWHLEGFELTKHYQDLVMVIQSNGREGVGLVIMSRGAAFPQVESWLSVGAAVSGVIGFSAGRTIFQNALRQVRSGEKSNSDAVRQIAENFLHFYQIFNKSVNLRS